jgi:hypothetical protein
LGLSVSPARSLDQRQDGVRRIARIANEVIVFDPGRQRDSGEEQSSHVNRKGGAACGMSGQSSGSTLG